MPNPEPLELEDCNCGSGRFFFSIESKPVDGKPENYRKKANQPLSHNKTELLVLKYEDNEPDDIESLF